MDLRKQIANVIGSTIILRTSPQEIADAVMAVVQPEIDTKDARIAELEARVDRFKKQRAGWSGISDLRDEANEYEAERDRLKATIDRVGALASELMTIDPADLTRAQRRQLPASVCRAVLAALAHPAAQPEESCSACAVPLALCREQGGRCCDACQHHQEGAKP